MAFWNREELPPELSGKKPEEIVAALKEAETHAAAAKAAGEAKTAAETAAAAAKTEAERLAARVAELEAAATTTTTTTATTTETTPASPWIDPEKFVQEQTAGITAVALHSGMMAAKMYFTQGLTPRDQKIFKKYEAEVEKGVNTFAPAARVMPQSWMNIFLYVKGLHDVDIHKAESDKADFFSEVPSRGAHDEPPPEDKLTEEEEQVCRVMHFDPKKYLEQKKQGATFGSGKGMYAKFSVPTVQRR